MSWDRSLRPDGNGDSLHEQGNQCPFAAANLGVRYLTSVRFLTLALVGFMTRELINNPSSILSPSRIIDLSIVALPFSTLSHLMLIITHRVNLSGSIGLVMLNMAISITTVIHLNVLQFSIYQYAHELRPETTVTNSIVVSRIQKPRHLTLRIF